MVGFLVVGLVLVGFVLVGLFVVGFVLVGFVLVVGGRLVTPGVLGPAGGISHWPVRPFTAGGEAP